MRLRQIKETGVEARVVYGPASYNVDWCLKGIRCLKANQINEVAMVVVWLDITVGPVQENAVQKSRKRLT